MLGLILLKFPTANKCLSRLVWGETVVQLRTKPPCWVIAFEATFHEKWSWNSVAYTKKRWTFSQHSSFFYISWSIYWRFYSLWPYSNQNSFVITLAFIHRRWWTVRKVKYRWVSSLLSHTTLTLFSVFMPHEGKSSMAGRFLFCQLSELQLLCLHLTVRHTWSFYVAFMIFS